MLLLGLSAMIVLTSCQGSAPGVLATTPASTQAGPQRPLSAASPADLGEFEVSNDKPLLKVSQEWRPYAQVKASPLGTGLRDATGVPMFKKGSKVYDHPVRQAQDGLVAMESYRISKDPRYLAQAQLDAQRLLDRKVQRDSAYFFPYPFNFSLHSKSANLIRAPWYSAMAQGQALSLFTRLADVTKKPSWRLAADATFGSLLLPPDPKDTTLPWVSWVDDDKHLWLEEYAQQPLAKSDRTFNGHIFAVFGVWDYYRISQDPRAAEIFAGALENVRYHVNRGWRNPQWISQYCMTHAQLDGKYHGVHVEQMRYLNAITGNSDWSVWSDLFQNDYPKPKFESTVRFVAGKPIGYQFDAEGTVIAARAVTINATSTAPASHRARIKGHQGYFYLITGGSLSGFWVQEKANAVSVPGLIVSTPYPYPRLASFNAQPHTGWKLAASGVKADSRTITLGRSSSASFDRSGWIDGVAYVHITNGGLAGRWVPKSGLTLH